MFSGEKQAENPFYGTVIEADTYFVVKAFIIIIFEKSGPPLIMRKFSGWAKLWNSNQHVKRTVALIFVGLEIKWGQVMNSR